LIPPSGGGVNFTFPIMKKLKKIILIAAILFVILVVAGVVLAGLFLDKIVKTGIETVAPAITQTTVKVDSVSISALSGSAGVKGMVIGNPEGFKSANAISIGKAAVSVVPSSVLGDKIIIRSVEVREPEITFEGSPLGQNNLKKIMDNVNAMAGAAPKADTNAPAAKSSGASKKLQVDDFLIAGAKVHVVIGGKEMTLPLPDIHLTGLGAGPEGITPAALIKEVLGQVTAATLKAVVASVSDLGKGVENLGKEAVGGATKTVGEGVNKITKGIGNLFGK